MYVFGISIPHLSRIGAALLCGLMLTLLACDRRTSEDCRQCVIGQQKCASDFRGILLCKQIISTGCIQFTLQRCDPGLVCVTPAIAGGVVSCQTEGQHCTALCTIGQKRCEGETITVCQTEAATGCPTWKPELTCGAGKPCLNGACQGGPQGCTPKNPQQQKKCVGNDLYWFDDCDKQGALIEQCLGTCKEAQCQTAGPCVPKITEQQKKCVGKEIYWFDDCDKQGALFEKCPDTCKAAKCEGKNGCTPTDNMYQKKCEGASVYWYDDCGGKRDLVETCPANKQCQSGVCAERGCTGGTDQCSAIDSRCSGAASVQSCSKNPANGCLEWGPLAPCGVGTTCQGGQCVRDPSAGGSCKTSNTGGQCRSDLECCKNQTCKKVLFIFNLCGPCGADSDCPKDSSGLPMRCCGSGGSSYCSPICL